MPDLYRQIKNGTVKETYRSTPEIRFWARIDKNGPAYSGLGRCWVWTRGTFDSGYGAITVRNKLLSTHRFAYELLVGPIPAGGVVRHKCDNPPCCNPKHLVLGNHVDNRRDCVSKGRQVKGVNLHSAKLDDTLVKRLRKEYRKGSRSNGTVALAKKYRVSQTAVMRVVSGLTWKHVQ